MKLDLLPKKQVYKANLHTHTTLSDGHLTPEEIADIYYRNGYSVLAITDHEFFMDHSDLCKPDFLLLTGYELQLVDPIRPRRQNQKCTHLCILSKSPHQMKHILFNPEDYDLRRLCKVPERIPQMEYVGEILPEKRYGVDLINEVTRLAKENNMLVAFNHPTWSLETAEVYSNIKGLYAMEIYNNACYRNHGIEEYNPRVYDEMLRSGQRLGCIAVDDAHAQYPLGHPNSDLCGGWTNILADSLTYENIVSALEKGDFYASTGPELYEISYEDGKIHVRSSDAVCIALTTDGRRAECVRGEHVNEATFAVAATDNYIRITVTDRTGAHANSRGYFRDEFIPQ